MDWAIMNETNWISSERHGVYRFAENLDAKVSMRLKIRDGVELEDLQADPELRQWISDWHDWLYDLVTTEVLPISACGQFENEKVKLEVDWGVDFADGEHHADRR
jgi:hypothetical protein